MCFLSFGWKITSYNQIFMADAQDMVSCHVNATSQRILPTHVARNQNASSTLMWLNSPMLPQPKLPSQDPPMPLPLSHLEFQTPTHSQLLLSPKASSLHMSLQNQSSLKLIIDCMVMKQLF